MILLLQRFYLLAEVSTWETDDRKGNRASRISNWEELHAILSLARLDMRMNKMQENCAWMDFDRPINVFEIFNCRDRETGRYTDFYIPIEYVDRFTGEKTTMETMGIVKQYNYEFMEG